MNRDDAGGLRGEERAARPPRPLEAEDAGPLAGVLGRSPEGDALPPMWHLACLLDPPQRAALGHDGHSRGGVPRPPDAPHRRMFAGGRAEHRAALRFGLPVAKTSAVVARARKEGRSGPLEFVTVRHEYAQDGRVAIVDEHDIVYRGLDPAAEPPAAREPVPSEPLHESRTFPVDPVTLFLFSAATANPHRIHYDLDFARSEGHPGLVVHGPLQVLLMAEWLREGGVDLVGARFDYRLLAPAWGEQVLVVGEPESGDAAVAVRAADGHRVARADVVR